MTKNNFYICQKFKMHYSSKYDVDDNKVTYFIMKQTHFFALQPENRRVEWVCESYRKPITSHIISLSTFTTTYIPTNAC